MWGQIASGVISGLGQVYSADQKLKGSKMMADAQKDYNALMNKQFGLANQSYLDQLRQRDQSQKTLDDVSGQFGVTNRNVQVDPVTGQPVQNTQGLAGYGQYPQQAQ